MFTGTSKCPVKPFKGTKLIYVPKNKLREYLYDSEIVALYPEFIEYIRSLFNPEELSVIDQEVGEIQDDNFLMNILTNLPIPPTNPVIPEVPRRTVRRRVARIVNEVLPVDHTVLTKDERAIQL